MIHRETTSDTREFETPGDSDFERSWLGRFAAGLAGVAGEEVKNQVMRGSEQLTSQSARREVVAWTQSAIERLDSLVDIEARKAIMLACSCRYPQADLVELRQAYQASKDIRQVHRMLQLRFESFLEQDLAISPEVVQEIVGQGWGTAGRLQDTTIIATKIPKSGHLLQYMRETDPARKRQLYCHCPRVREALQMAASIPATYCYCGAGFYKGIWQAILDEPVEVEVLESVLQGDEICQIAVRLPKHVGRCYP